MKSEFKPEFSMKLEIVKRNQEKMKEDSNNDRNYNNH